MIVSEERCIPSMRVGYYAERVLSDLRLGIPPTPTEEILEYFGAKLCFIGPKEMRIYRQRFGEVPEIPAFLCHSDGAPLIFVNEDSSLERRRMSILHECGHLDIPWHRDKSYLCDLGDEKSQMKKYESEAFEYAGHLLFPSEAFYGEINHMPISITTVEYLAKKHQASFEATAIKYVKTHPRKCAIVYLVENTVENASEFSFAVRYSVKSKSFYGYWKPQCLVKYDQLLLSCFSDRQPLSGSIPASVFGSGKSHVYKVELRPHGPDQVCALLEIEDRQTSFMS